MIYLPGLVLALAALWFALSGETSPMFLGLGAISVLAVLWLAARLRVLGRDASPYHRAVQFLFYIPGLLVRVAASNLAVIVKILGPRSAIDPAMVKVNTVAKTDLGRALFANSITLTPGTVTVDVEDDKLLVHALVREAAPASSFGPMDRAAARAADGKA